MPWYYAGPEAKPVGPVTLEELQSLRARGMITPETYVIEETGQGSANLAWRRFREVFPALPNLPPVPHATPPPFTPAATPPPFIPPGSSLPQMKQMTREYGQQQYPFDYGATASRPPLANRPTNGWCAWGFGLGLAAFFFSFLCGIGLLPALLSIPLCVVGLVQLAAHREQAGKWLAIWGLVLSSLALMVSLVLIGWLAMPIMKAHGLTVTEETTNDSNSSGRQY